MNRGLEQRLGSGTWEAVIDGLVAAGAVTRHDGMFRTRYEVTDPAARDAIVDRLHRAAAGDEPLDAPTALVLSMTGPANLLEVVAPDRRSRKHARHRIDRALDSSNLESIGDEVRSVLAEVAAAAAVAASVAATSAATS
jgi:hypothetical protein